jgi:copper(I)-binding protein
MNKLLIVLIASIVLGTTVQAQTTVTGAWVRATVPQQSASGAFMQLHSHDAARLVKVSSPAARSVEMHQMKMSGQLMKMRELDSIELPADQTVNLASGGFHIMLVGLKRQFKEGDSVPLSLVIERKTGKRETIVVNAQVKPLTFTGSQGSAPIHH